MLLRQKKDLSYENLDFPKKNILSGGNRLSLNYESKKQNFSIITVVLNNVISIEETIKSVVNQSEDFEYIVIDGGSDDGTLDIIRKYEKYINLWISEKDYGIYDAMNKGIKYSTGNYLGILNSGDLYNPNALSIISKYLEENANLDFIFGTVFKKKLKHGFNKKKIYWSFDFYPSHSSGFFISKIAQKKIGLYNTDFKLSADHDLFFRLIKGNFKGTSTKKNELIGQFRKIDGSYSSTFSSEEHVNEEIKIRLKNNQNKLVICLIILNNYLRKIFKKRKYSISFKLTFNLIKHVIKQA